MYILIELVNYADYEREEHHSPMTLDEVNASIKATVNREQAATSFVFTILPKK